MSLRLLHEEGEVPCGERDVAAVHAGSIRADDERDSKRGGERESSHEGRQPTVRALLVHALRVARPDWST